MAATTVGDIVGNSVLYAIGAEAIYQEPTGKIVLGVVASQ
jgi:hypothetical protein